MVSVFDVAAFILKKRGRTPALKLQKLVYYCQAWSLVWDDRPLFRARIEAWANGPVVPSLYKLHRRQYDITSILEGDPNKLSAEQRQTVLAVLDYYGDKSSQWLADLTHMEEPWKKARAGIPDGVRSNAEISLASMAEYYSSL